MAPSEVSRSASSTPQDQRLLVLPLPQMVFFAGTTKPLHIFESQYIDLVYEAVETKTLIGLAQKSRSFLSESRGTLAGVHRTLGVGEPIIYEKRSDGSLLVLVESRGKMRLLDLLSSPHKNMVCDASWVNEKNQLEQQNIFLLNRLFKDFSRWLREMVPDRMQRETFLNFLTRPFEKINYMASFMVTDSVAQQALLEMDDINHRLWSLRILRESDAEDSLGQIDEIIF